MMSGIQRRWTHRGGRVLASCLWAYALIWPIAALADEGAAGSGYGFHAGHLPPVARDVEVTYRASMNHVPPDIYRIRLRIKRGGMPYVIDFPNAAHESGRPWMPFGGFDDSYWIVDTRPGQHSYYVAPTNRNFNSLGPDPGPFIDIMLASYARTTDVAGQPCELWHAVRAYPHFLQHLEICLSRDGVVLRVTPRRPGIMDTLEAETVTYRDLPAALFEVPADYPLMMSPPPRPPHTTADPFDGPG